MATEPPTNETIALTEKKMDMTLDDIIRMSKDSKKPTPNLKKPRVPNKSQKFSNGDAGRGNSSNVQGFMDSRSFVRQGVLSQRRSKFQNNQFHSATAVARNAAAAPVRGWPMNRNRAPNWNKPRIGTSPLQHQTAGRSFSPKRQQQQQQQQQQPMKIVSKPGGQTLDSLFANMKQQRMRVLSQQKNNAWHNERGGQQQRGGRGKFGYMANNRSFRPRMGFV